MSLSEDHSTANPEVALPEVGEGDRPGLQDRPAVPVSGDTVPVGSSRGLPRQTVRGLQPVCYPRQESYHHAKRHQVGKMNPGRKNVKAPLQNTNISVLFRTTPILQKE